MKIPFKSILKWSTVCGGMAVGGYATYAAFAFARYGAATGDRRNQMSALNSFMPEFEVSDHHSLAVHAPAAVAFQCACECDMMQSPIVKALFKARELLLFGRPSRNVGPRGLRALVESIGWSVLFEVPDREVVMGSVTQPWQAEPVFQKLSAKDFVAFRQPDYLKIVWSLQAEELSPEHSVLRVETRALATDPSARLKFRPYWALGSPGIKLIRVMLLREAMAAAERSARAQTKQLSQLEGRPRLCQP